jgi:stage V sporulation protein R
VITAEQMLDAYSLDGHAAASISTGRSASSSRANELRSTARASRGLAYEIVINSNPCIVYIMEENSATMQTLVIAHAAFGHNHFFKNNYVFKQWTDADGILDYLEFAKRFIAQCEERYGQLQVERVLDAAHALQSHGIHRFPRKRMPDARPRRQNCARERAPRTARSSSTISGARCPRPQGKQGRADAARPRPARPAPREHLLYFLEKTAPRLASLAARDPAHYPRDGAVFLSAAPDQGDERGLRHLLRAPPDHDRAARARPHHRGLVPRIPHLAYQRRQPADVRRSPLRRAQSLLGWLRHDAGHRPRLPADPTEEDRNWLPDIAGGGDIEGTLKHIWANYRDESFISQFLSPRLMRSWRMFKVADREKEEAMKVDAIHDERGYREIRRALARQYDISWQEPDIQIVDVDLAGDRKLVLEHHVTNGVLLADKDADRVVQHLADLWGYEVVLNEVDDEAKSSLKEHRARPRTGGPRLAEG